MLSLEIDGYVVRSFAPIGLPDTGADFQEWSADHLRTRWSQVQRLNEQFANGAITADQWFTEFDEILFEGHSNAWWIGRNFAGDDSEFGNDDLLIGRGYKDAETQYLSAFMDDLKAGRYIDANGDVMLKAIHARSRLYVGKMRGTASDAFVDATAEDGLFYWLLGGNEEHCLECPEYAKLFDGVAKSELFTAPGAGDTPCLGNCLCYLKSVVGSVSRFGPKSVSLPYDNEDFNQTAAAA